MRSEAKETARLYSLLTDKLGGDVTEAMFNYIDTKTVQSVEATIKTLATKEDLRVTKDDLRKEIALVRSDLHKEIVMVKDDLAKFRYDLSKQMGELKADTIKWMFVFWIGQIGGTLAIIFLFLKK